MPEDQSTETANEKQLKFKQRLKDFAKNAVLACRDLKASASRYIASQVIRCSTSVAANYRAACRARSKREFIAKSGIVLEEADETSFWLEFASDLVAIFTATLKTAKKHLPKGQ